MFFHVKNLQFEAIPEAPDPVLAKKMQELIGGAYGEMTVALQYLFQAWNCRGPAKYKDMLLDIGTEEIGHVEMVSTMVGQLLQGVPLSENDPEAMRDPVALAKTVAMSSKHLIVSGLGALPSDSVGYPWSGNFIVASGNLLADFRDNLAKESHGRIQAIRIYESTQDKGVKKLLEFMIARDYMHQLQFLAAIEELEADGLEGKVAPTSFDPARQNQAAAYQFMNFSQGEESSLGRWANGVAPDGKGSFEYVAAPKAEGQKADPMPKGDPRLHNTGK